MLKGKTAQTGSAGKLIPAIVLCIVLGGGSAAADGFRNIAVIGIDYYFDGSYRVALDDVFLARFCTAFSLQVKLSRSDRPDFYEHVLSIGPVINFSERLYLDALYGIGIDSQVQVEHKAEINLTYEAPDASLGLGIRGAFFTVIDYWFLIPSAGAKIQVAAWFALFNKLFLSIDSLGVFCVSYWGELQWITGEAVTIRTGGTVNWSGAIGYSLMAGIDVHFSPTVLLKYHIQFLADMIDFSYAPMPVYGIQNGLFLDIKF